MKAKELKELTLEELRSKEQEMQETLFNFKFQHATGLLENTMRIPASRKDLARIKTAIREKSLQRDNTEGA